MSDNLMWSPGNAPRRLPADAGFEDYVVEHLWTVYKVVGTTVLSSMGGCYLNVNDLVDFGALSDVGSLLLVISLYIYQYDGQNFYSRYVILQSIGFLSGVAIGPLVTPFLYVDPPAAASTLFGSLLIFMSLSATALMNETNEFVAHGDTLFRVRNYMVIASLCNLIIQSPVIYTCQMYIGLCLTIGFILLDTQSMVEQRRSGVDDVVGHALNLFSDVFSLFRRLLVFCSLRYEQFFR